MRLYIFRQRLANVCKDRRNNYKYIDESFTVVVDS
jgi:hypothetical protein